METYTTQVQTNDASGSPQTVIHDEVDAQGNPAVWMRKTGVTTNAR